MAHPNMSKAEWEGIYREAWSLYYTPEHMRTLLRRAVATGVPLHSLVKLLVTFATAVPLENIHPLQTGILRLMHPSERRPGLPRENPFVFWPRFIWQSLRKNALIIGRIVHLSVVAHRISRRDDAKRYMDPALTPVDDHDDETLDLLTKVSEAG